MQKINKKALSPVIANILLVLLVIASASILYFTVFNIVKKTSEQISLSPTECINLQNNLEITKACYNNENKEVETTLYTQSSPTRLKTLDFLIQYANYTETFTCGESCRNCEIIKKGTKTYYIPLEKKPESLTLRINDCIIQNSKIENC